MTAKREAFKWGLRAFPAPSRSRLRCGRLLVEFSGGDNEVCLASRQFEEKVAESLERDEPVAWTNWAVCTGASGLEILPALPDRPVLAKPEAPFTVAPGEETRVYLRIPVWVLVRLADNQGELLAELPSETLEPVSFGGIPVTEQCYQLSAPSTRRPVEEFEFSEIQAPVVIRNESREVLSVTQICLRVAPLSLYLDARGLWTSETLARYQGGIHPSRLSIRGGPPSEAPQARWLAPSRSKPAGTTVGRTFRSFLRLAEDWR